MFPDHGDRRERGKAARAIPTQLRETSQLQVRHRRCRLRRVLLQHVSIPHGIRIVPLEHLA